MAKKSTKTSFNKAIISKDEEKYIITEIGKDSSSDYNLTAVLDSYVGMEGISLSIGVDDNIPEIDDEDDE